MQAIQTWFKKYGVWTHVVAAAVFLVGAFDYVPGFHSLVMQGYALIPKWAQTAVVTGIALYAWYRKGQPATPAVPAGSGGAGPAVGALMLCVLLIGGTLPMTGCSATTVAQDIVNWTPALDSAASAVGSLDPVLLPEATAFIVLQNTVDTFAKGYLANPSASVLQQLQAAVVTAQQQANSALLSAARIVDPATQKHVLAAVQTYGSLVNIILGLVASISPKASVVKMAAQANVKISMVRPYLDDEKIAETMAAHYGEPLGVSQARTAYGELMLERAGF